MCGASVREHNWAMQYWSVKQKSVLPSFLMQETTMLPFKGELICYQT